MLLYTKRNVPNKKDERKIIPKRNQNTFSTVLISCHLKIRFITLNPTMNPEIIYKLKTVLTFDEKPLI